MNFVFGVKSGEGVNRKHFLLLLILRVVGTLAFATLAIILFYLWVKATWFVGEQESVGVDENSFVVAADAGVLRSVAESFGVPYGPAVRLSEYLVAGDFSGVGLYRIKPVHLDMLQNRFVPGAAVDLEDPVLNANIALGLIADFHGRGYSWEQSFLIYVYGWGDLAPVTRSVEAQEFLDFVFGGGVDE
jgi:hypothetical protein